MIDIDFSKPVDEVRANIGDPLAEFVTDGTITSALTKYKNDVNKTSIAVMQVMLAYFATQADRERTDQEEVYFTNLYERYKDLYKDLKKRVGQKVAAGIIIGGVSLTKKNEVICDPDIVQSYNFTDWHDINIQSDINRLYEETINRSYPI